MSQFTERIRTAEGELDFYFNRIYTAEGTRYHVSTIGKMNKSFSCSMEQKNTRWILIPLSIYPGWLVALEKELGDAISRHIVNSDVH